MKDTKPENYKNQADTYKLSILNIFGILALQCPQSA